jgi:hypothetical protein
VRHQTSWPSSVEERPGGDPEKRLVPIASAAQVRRVGLSPSLPRAAGRRERAAVWWRHNRMEAEMSSVEVSSESAARMKGRVSGPAPEHADYGSFAAFSDPDGNGWLLQEIKTRLPGR